MAVDAEDRRIDPRSERIRVPYDIYQAIKGMAAREGVNPPEVVAALLRRALVAQKGGTPADDAVLEAAFCRALAKAGDEQEVLILKETANFRAVSVMTVVLNHLRWGITNGTLYE